MHRVEYHRRALKALRRIPKDRARQIIAAIDDLANTDDPTTHPDVSKMQGKWDGSWRLRVGSYRVIFELLRDSEEEEIHLIYIIDIGTRGDIYG